MTAATDRGSCGIVLAGAAALGAYEAGVLRALTTELARELGRAPAIDVLSGTSAGAINAAALAATADNPAAGVARLCEVWSGLQLGAVLRPSAVELLWMLVETGNGPAALRRSMSLCGVRGGLLNPRALRRLLERSLPMARIQDHLRAGRLRGIAIAATHVATGRATVFVASAGPVAWPATPSLTAVPTELRIDHVLASASIPLLFPAVDIDGDLYCDGGLRQIVPLSPALHLGATRLIVIDPLPRALGSTRTDDILRREAIASPFYLAGKALNALFADRIEVDLERLDQVSAIIRAGRRRFGPTFETAINDELRASGGHPLRPVQAIRIKPSADLGALAVDYAMRPAFAARARGPAARILRHLAEAGPTRSGDLLAYLMFDGGFATELIELGRADARARRHDLLELFADAPRAAVG